MAFVFKLKDVIHKIAVKFVSANLPGAKKAFYLRPVRREILDIENLAAKAEIYKIDTSPAVIIEGFNAVTELIYYVTADGYKVSTDLFTSEARFPGVYDGTETSLAEGVFPQVRVRASRKFPEYIKKNARPVFDGMFNSEGSIIETVNDATGLADKTVSSGRLLTIKGYGLKIDAEEDKKALAGVFFRPAKGVPIKVTDIAINNPRLLKVIVPSTLEEGTAYTLAVETQSSVNGGSTILKNMRDIRSNFTLTVIK